jgi:hypothetical protein
MSESKNYDLKESSYCRISLQLNACTLGEKQFICVILNFLVNKKTAIADSNINCRLEDDLLGTVYAFVN